jgi:hypothetical protein
MWMNKKFVYQVGNNKNLYSDTSGNEDNSSRNHIR